MRKIGVIDATGNTGAYLADYLCTHAAEDCYEIFTAGHRNPFFCDCNEIGYANVDVADASTPEVPLQEDVYVMVLFAGPQPMYMRSYKSVYRGAEHVAVSRWCRPSLRRVHTYNDYGDKLRRAV